MYVINLRNYPNIGSPLLNTTTNATVPPVVEMRIVDAKTQQETSDSQIGQNLQLIIELKEKSSNAKTQLSVHLLTHYLI